MRIRTPVLALALVALLIVFSLNVAYAGVILGKPSLKLFTSAYGPEQPFDGYLNFSLKEVASDSKISFMIDGGSSSTKEFYLLDTLDELDIPYFCSPFSCESTFLESSPSQSKTINFDCSQFPCKKSGVGLLIEGSRIGSVVIESINFTMRGQAADGSYPTPLLDVGDDGTIDWLYLEPSDNFAAIPNNFDANDKKGEKIFDGAWEYCQNITLPAAKRFRFASSNLVDVPGVAFNLRSAQTRFPIQNLTSCTAAANSACTVNFTVTESKDFLLCVNASAGKIPYYGGGAKRGYFFNKGDSSVARQQYDFPISASYAKFKQLDFTAGLDEEEINAISDAVQEYLLDSCDHEAEKCVVPLAFNSSTKGSIVLENLKISQSNLPPEPSYNFYSFEKIPAKVNASAAVIDFSEFELRTPRPSGYPNDFEKKWGLKVQIADKETPRISFTIERVPSVALKPLAGVAGFPIKFDASGSRALGSSLNKIVEFEWDFGDESEPVVTQDASAVHTYAATGNYTLTLGATDSNGVTGVGTFTVRIGGSSEAVGSIISQRFSAFDSFKRSLPADTFERNLILEALGIDEQSYRQNLTFINETYKIAMTLPAAQRDQNLAMILDELQALELPSRIFDSFTFNSKFVPDVDIVSPEYVTTLSGEQALSGEDVKNAIALWQQENLDLSLSAKVKGAEYVESVEPIFSIIRISLTPLASASSSVSDYYLILSLPGTILASGGSYEQQELAPGVFGFKISGERELVLAVDTIEFSEIKAFASPKLSELELIGAVCGDDFCDAGAGEDSGTCSLDCGRKIPGTAIFITLLLFLIAAAAIFFIWHRHAHDYKKRLFKSKRDYESIMSFVEKGFVLKLPSEEIRQKLRKAGWADEQINYAMSEAAKSSEEKAKKKQGGGGRAEALGVGSQTQSASSEKPKRKFFSFGSKNK